MDLTFNVCIAWLCRSTHPFQTFLVYINGQFGWSWPTLLLYYPEILQSTLSLPRTGIEHVGISEFCHAHAYLSQVRIKCGTLWRLLPKSTRLLAAYFTTHTFHLDAPYTRLPLLVSVPVWNLFSCKEGNENPPTQGNLHILLVSIHFSYLSTFALPISFPNMGSSVGILWIQVASDSAIGTSWFWFASRACPKWRFNSSLGLF